MKSYDIKDIKRAYQEIGIKRGSTVCLRTHLPGLGPFAHMRPREEILHAHFNILSELIDLDQGTLVVPTFSSSLCNTDIVFDPAEIPSETGVLTEFIRKNSKAIRSFHPFFSYTAIGKNAKYICENVSRNAYGYATPSARMLELDTLDVSIGRHPRFMCSLIHHLELLMAVPYRYTKEFNHLVKVGEKIEKQLFYLYVWYRNCDIERDKNEKIFNHFIKWGGVLNKTKLGMGKVYSFRAKDYASSAIEAFKNDIYIWLKHPPEQRPYRV